MITIKDSFRVYNSYEDSFKGYYAFLETNPRYTRYGIFGEWNYKKACQKIQASGYASATNYEKSLLSIIEPFGLAKYDAEALALRKKLYERKVYTTAFLNLSTEGEALTIRNWVNTKAKYVGDITKSSNTWTLKFQNISTRGECESILAWVKEKAPYKGEILEG